MTTFKDVIAEFRSFFAAHKQVNTFYSGQPADFQTQTNIFPAVILVPAMSIIADGTVKLNFNLFVCDRENDDRSNTNEIYSDTLSIIADFLAYFDSNQSRFGFTLDAEEVAIEPFEEEFDSVGTGWAANIEVTYTNPRSKCNIPI